MADPAHVATDEFIAEIEKKLKKQYSKAAREIQEKLEKHLEAFREKVEGRLEALHNGEITKQEYENWFRGQVATGQRWKDLQGQIADDLLNVNAIARSTAEGYKPDVYALNINYATYDVEHAGLLDTSFTLYDHQTVERVMREEPALLPPPGKLVAQEIAEGKAKRWNLQIFNSVMTQGIIQGESIDKIAKRISSELSTRNYAASVRYARTAMTSAQNAGRYDGYRRARDMGVELKIEWQATLDNRTRHEHRQLHGQRREIDEPFEVIGTGGELIKIMYPADAGPGSSDIPQSMIWNCRCTLLGWVKGFEGETVKSSPKMGDMDFEEWQDEKMTLAAAEGTEKHLESVAASKPGFDEQFTGIWKNKTVTYSDYEDVKGSIQSKKDYYINELKNATGYRAADLKDKLDAITRFEKNGEEYSQLLKDIERAKKNVARLTPVKPAGGQFGAEAYTQARKDAALWAKTKKDADNALRPRCGEVWRAATKEQRSAIYEYTSSYHKFNEPLRGIEYGSNVYKGVGNADLNAGWQNNGKKLNAMTDIIEKSTYNEDIWLQRGVYFDGMDKFFGCDMSLLRNGTQEELENELLGKAITEFGFMSCGSSKGSGFNGDILLNVYAPSGTKMMYVEPFSAFGSGSGKSWDGLSTQSSFGSELETILQQGTRFRVSKIERRGTGKIYMDIEVIDQSAVQRWVP